MTKGKLLKQVRKIALSVGITLAVGLVPSAAEAVVGGSANELSNGGGDLQGNQVYFGYHKDSFGSAIAFDGYEWYVIGNTKDNALRVLLKSTADKNGVRNDLPYIGKTAFYSNYPFVNSYKDSVLHKAMMDSFGQIENGREKNIVQGRTLEGGSSNYTTGTNYPTGIAGAEVEKENAKFWPLSTAEVVEIGGVDFWDYNGSTPSDIAKFNASTGYWLRSPGSYKSSAAYVANGNTYDGKFFPGGLDVNNTYPVVRPAFDLTLKSRLLTSSTNVASDGVKGGGSTSSTDWKEVDKLLDGAIPKYTMTTEDIALTIEDKDKTFTVGKHDKEITIKYSGATFEPDKPRESYQGNHLSALITVKGKDYYLKTPRLDKASGEVTFKLPSDIVEGEYKLKVFNEEINETDKNFKYTDFASVPITLDVKIVDQAQVTSATPSSDNPLIPVDHKNFELAFDAELDDTKLGTVKLVQSDDAGKEFTLEDIAISNSDGKATVTGKLKDGDILAYNKTYKYEIGGFEGNNGMAPKQVSSEFNFKTMGREVKPNAVIAYEDQKLTGLIANAEYIIKIGDGQPETKAAGNEGNLAIEDDWVGQKIEVVKKGTANQTHDSEADKHTLSRAKAPEDITAKPATTGKSDGEIHGVDNTMQYHNGNGIWTDCSADKLTGLATGTYSIRMKSSNAKKLFFSPTVEITINEVPFLTDMGETIAFDGYEWYIIGNGQTGVYPNSGRLTLFLKSGTGKDGELPYEGYTTFKASALFSDEYKGSDLQTAMNDSFASVKNTKEKELIKVRDLEGGSDNYDQDEGTYPTGIKGDPVPDAKFWPLSTSEALDIGGVIQYSDPTASEIAKYTKKYWLRSPGRASNTPSQKYAAVGNVNGMVGVNGDRVDFGLNPKMTVVRPAFDFSLERYLLTSTSSMTSGAKSDWISGEKLYESGTKKLTMISDDLKLNGAGITFDGSNDLSGKTIDSHADLKIAYATAVNAATDPDHYVKNTLSAILYDSDQKIVAYQQVAEIDTGGATDASFKLPAGTSDGAYTLKLFNEEVNKELYSNFASAATTLNFEVKNTVPKVETVIPEGENIPVRTNEIKLTFDTKMDEAVGEVKLVPNSGAEIILKKEQVKWSADGKTATYTLPNGTQLAYNTEYMYKLTDFKGASGGVFDGTAFNKTFKTIRKESAESVKIKSYTNPMLEGFEAGFSYEVNGESVTPANGELEIKSEWIGTTIKVVKKSWTGEAKGDSNEHSITLNQADEPSITANPATTGNSDGVIFGVNDTMQYHTGDGSWQDCSNADITGLSAGEKYYIRVKGSDADKRFYSPTVEITIVDSTIVTTIGDSIAFNGYEWYIVGNGQSGVYPVDNHLTLFLKTGQVNKSDIPAEFSPRIFGSDATYEGSNVDLALKDAYNNSVDNNKEKELIAKRELAASKTEFGGRLKSPDTIYGDQSVNANFWPLSAKEAKGINNQNILKYSHDSWEASYWLRSPGSHKGLAAFVLKSGGIVPGGVDVDDDQLVVRPAFSLPVSQLLLTSSASGDVKGTGGTESTDWKEVSSLLPDGTIPKLTLIDKTISLKVADKDKTFYVDKNAKEITVNYTEATHNLETPRDSYQGNHLSTLLTIEGKEYYLKTPKLDSDSGAVTFKLPSTITAGNYTLRVFNEEINQKGTNGNYTDFASEPIELDVKVGDSPKINQVDPIGNFIPINQNEFSITFDKKMDQTIDGTIKLLPNGGAAEDTITLEKVVWNAEGTKVTYRMPSNSQLAYGTEYTYHITGFKSSSEAGAMPLVDVTSGYSFTTMAQEETPVLQIDYENEKLTHFETGASYKIEIDNSVVEQAWSGDQDFPLTNEEWFGKNVKVTRNGIDHETVSSEPLTFTLPERNTAPTVTVTPETRSSANDGQMTADPAANVEYKKANEINWTAYTDTLIGLSENTVISFRTAHVPEPIGEFAQGKFRSSAIDMTMVSRPSVALTTPTTDAPVTGELIVAFDRAMDTSTTGTVKIAPANTEAWQTLTAVANPWSSGDTQYTVAYSNLVAGQTYKLAISGFKDSSLTMVDDLGRTLTVADKPTITAVTPSGSASKVPVETAEVAIQFNVPMMAQEGTVILTDEENESIAAEFKKWNDAPTNQTALYTITGLEYGKKYSYTISGFVSQKGTELEENKDYSFTTIGKETTPELTLNYVAEQVSGFDQTAKYQIDDGETIQATEILDISNRITDNATTFDIVKLGTAGESVNSDAVTIELPARPAAPSGLTIKPATDDQTADGEITGIENTMEYSKDNGASWTPVTDKKISKLAKDDKVMIRVSANNEAKRFRSETTEVTMVDRPTVVNVETEPNAPTDGSLDITFNREMAEAPGTVMIGEDTLDLGTWNADRTVYTVNYKNLAELTEYQVTISGFKDASGYEMKENTGFTITIGDHQAPIVEQVKPLGDAVSIDTNQLTITFNETVKADSGIVTVEGLTIENPSSSGEGNNAVTYDLSGLERNKTYTVSISGFTDNAGNVMKAGTHQFSTEKSTYTIVFDKGATDATGSMTSQPMTYGSKTKLAANTFQRIGYTFAGWKEGANSYTNEQEVENLTEQHEATITLTAQWKANSYQATFDSNQGTGTIDGQTVEYGGTCTLPTEGCTRDGYRLVGWSTSPIPGGGTTYGLGEAIPWNFVSDTTFYAVWQAEYTVRFNPDNGEAITEQKILAGGLAIPPTNPVKANYSFGGWLFNGSLYNFDLPVNQNMDLIARWQKVYHTVNFEANGGAGSTKRTVMSGTTVTEPEVFYYGHRLIGWSTSPSGGALWDFNTAVTDEMTLYAQWEAVPSYTLRFNTNGGDAINDVTELEDTVIDLSNYRPTREGYTFAGWFNDAGLTVAVAQVRMTTHQTVYAKWAEVTETDRYTLSFNSNGGSEVQEEVHDDGEVVQLASYQPTREGYTLAGWYDNAALSGQAITSVTMTQNQVVHAKWTAESYQVMIDPAGGTGDTTPLTATYDDSFAFPTADGYEKEGYQLIGWQIGTTSYEAGLTLPQWRYDSNQIMTAIWMKNTYEIQFDSREGTTVASQYIEHGERVIEPTPPSRTGYSFIGWYLTADVSGDPVDFENYTATEGTILFAGWQSETFYEVRFESRDGKTVESVQVREGEKTPIPNSWEWPGYTFDGWFTAKGEAIEQLKISDPTTFIAKWTAIPYQAILRNPHAPDARDKEITINYTRDNLKALPVPKRRGYTFAGWQEVSRSRAVGEIHHDMSRLFGNVVLEANWLTNTYNVVFDTAGGENLNPIVFTVEEAVNKLPTPTRAGYLFQGWFDQNGKEVTSIAKDTVGDQMLTARWLVDKTELAALVAEEAEKKRSADIYTEQSWRSYQAALAQANTVLAKEEATAQEVAEALNGMQTAIKGLKAKGTIVTPIDTTKPTSQTVTSGKQYVPTNAATQSKKPTSLLQTGEEQSLLYLIAGILLVGLVIPIWKKKQDLSK